MNFLCVCVDWGGGGEAVIILIYCDMHWYIVIVNILAFLYFITVHGYDDNEAYQLFFLHQLLLRPSFLTDCVSVLIWSQSVL